MDKMDEIKDKSKSIINCYLDFITTLYAELSSSYVNCLTMTGIAQPNMNNLSVDSLMQYPLDSKCKTIYDQMLFAANGFKEILDLLFKDKPQEAHDWHKVLDSKIKNLRYWKHPQNTIPFSGKGGKDKYIRM
jgi:hypothetical protein